MTTLPFFNEGSENLRWIGARFGGVEFRKN
jgi:hypothetical protein